MTGRVLAAFGLLAGLGVAATPAAGQRVELKASKGPYYVGTPVEIHVVAEDFEEEPTPEIHFESPPGVQLAFLGVSPNVRSQITIVNGRVSRMKEVQFTYRYSFSAQEAGQFPIGPFRVSQGGTEVATRSATVRVRDVPLTERLGLRVSWPDAPVFPGQRVPVVIEWRFASDLQNVIHRYVIASPVFDRGDEFRFVDEPPRAGGAELVVQTSRGSVTLGADISTESVGGEEFRVIRAERVLIPLVAGVYDLPPASVVVDEVTRWQRDLFGGRTPSGIRKLRAVDVPRRLVVRDLPRLGRPESFAGAIGRGFSLDASADRSVVQVGDPIELTFTLRGDGNLVSAGPPDLSADGGLSPDAYRLPVGDPSGALEDGAKVFRLSIRVLDDSVEEIPPIAYSYFDPESGERGEYVTVYSRPIALQVRPASIVTARDVVSGVPGESGPPGAEGESPANLESERESMSGSLRLTGANLSIERDPRRLLRPAHGPEGGVALQLALYTGPLLMIALALVSRRRADLDPEVADRRRRLREQRSRIDAARGSSGREAMSLVADALRAMLREMPDRGPAGLDDFLAECEDVIYAPEATSDPALDPALHARAVELADAMLAAAQ